MLKIRFTHFNFNIRVFNNFTHFSFFKSPPRHKIHFEQANSLKFISPAYTLRLYMYIHRLTDKCETTTWDHCGEINSKCSAVELATFSSFIYIVLGYVCFLIWLQLKANWEIRRSTHIQRYSHALISLYTGAHVWFQRFVYFSVFSLVSPMWKFMILKQKNVDVHNSANMYLTNLAFELPAFLVFRSLYINQCLIFSCILWIRKSATKELTRMRSCWAVEILAQLFLKLNSRPRGLLASVASEIRT